MKMISAVIRPLKFDDIKDDLCMIGVFGLTIMEAQGCGQQLEQGEILEGKPFDIDLLPKKVINIIVSNDKADQVVQVIQEKAFTGEVGDGQIAVISLDSVIRIRTGEKQEN